MQSTHRHPAFHRPSLIALAIVAWGTTVPSARAQSASEREPLKMLSEVKVTADELPAEADTTERSGSYRAKRSTSATGLALTPRETPQSLSTITHAQMRDFGLTTVNDALSTAAGVTVEKVETDRTYYSARGFDIDNFQLDGIGMPFTNGAQWGDVDALVYDRIDVLRGANGLMTGVGQPSATINFVRKKPTAAFQASAGLTLGSWARKRVEADVSGSLKADQSVRGRLIVAAEDADSYLDRYGKYKQTVYGAVDVDLGPATTLSMGLLSQDGRARSPMWGALPMLHADGTQTDYDTSTSTAADWAWWNNSDQRVHAELQHAWDNSWNLRTVLTHREMKSDSELFYLYSQPQQGTGQGMKIYPSAFAGDYTQDMLNVQATGPYTLAGRRHELSAGLSWAHEEAQERSGYSTVTNEPFTADLHSWNGQYFKPDFNASYNGSDFRAHSKAAFASTRLNLADTFKLLVGGRFTHVTSNGQNYGVAHAYERSQTTPYLGLVWDAQPDVSVYASATRIFKPQTEIDRDRKVLAPIQSRNTELGIKADLFDKQVSAQVAVFDTRQKGVADSAGYDSTFNYSYYRGIDARSRGIEAELTGRLSERLAATGSATHLSLKNSDGQDVRTFIPRDTVRAGLRYQATDRLSTTANLRWQSGIHREVVTDTGITGTVRQRAYALLDMGASYDITPKLKASAQLRNVTNQKYLNSLYWDQAYYGAPRHGLVSLNWTY